MVDNSGKLIYHDPETNGTVKYSVEEYIPTYHGYQVCIIAIGSRHFFVRTSLGHPKVTWSF